MQGGVADEGPEAVLKQGLVGAAAAQAWQGPTGPGMHAGSQEGWEGGWRQAPSCPSPCCPEPATKQPEAAVSTRKPSSRGIAQVKGPGLWGMQGAHHVEGHPCLMCQAGLPPAPACPRAWPALSTDAQARRPGRRPREACKMGVLGNPRVEPRGNLEGQGTGAGAHSVRAEARGPPRGKAAGRGDEHAWVPSSLSLPSWVTWRGRPAWHGSLKSDLGQVAPPREPQFPRL